MRVRCEVCKVEDARMRRVRKYARSLFPYYRDTYRYRTQDIWLCDDCTESLRSETSDAD